MSATSPLSVKIVRHGIPTEELIADVKAVAKQLQTDRLSGNRYNSLGQFSATTLIRRIGSWTAALQLAGLRPAHSFHLDSELALADLQRVARLLGASSVRVDEYRWHGRFTTDALRKRFGAWHRALLAAGLHPGHCHGLTHAELFENLKQVWEKLNQQPRMADMRPPVSRCTVGPYISRFKTWTQALRAFDQSLHPESTAAEFVAREKYKRVSTHINWRLRYQILQRDHFRCCACGRSPVNDAAVKLQIDHIHPRSRGGASDAENLQTLCERCNVGKGDWMG